MIGAFKTFTQQLDEGTAEAKSSRVKKLSDDQVKDYLEQHCSNILDVYSKSPVRIYRGLKNFNDSYGVGTSTETERKSFGTTNEYTLILDNLQAWSQYPKRSRSWICATSSYYAWTYGKVYVVFPENGTKIGICPTLDIWESFPALFDRMNDILNVWDRSKSITHIQRQVDALNDVNTVIGKIYRCFVKRTVLFPKDNERIDQSWEIFKEACSQLDVICKKLINDKEIDSTIYELAGDYKPFLKKIYSKSDSFLKFLQDGMDPDENGFELKTERDVGSFSHAQSLRSNKGKEVWFSGTAVFVSKDKIQDLL